MCKYCEGRTIEDIPFRTNVQYPMFTALIALTEDEGKELVIHASGIAYGLQINYCPMCGRKLNNKSVEDEADIYVFGGKVHTELEMRAKYRAITSSDDSKKSTEEIFQYMLNVYDA